MDAWFGAVVVVAVVSVVACVEIPPPRAQPSPGPDTLAPKADTDPPSDLPETDDLPETFDAPDGGLPGKDAVDAGPPDTGLADVTPDSGPPVPDVDEPDVGEPPLEQPCDPSDEVCPAPYSGFSWARALHVFEPAHLGGETGASPPASLIGPQSPQGQSTWERKGEVLEVTMSSGVDDGTLAAWWPLSHASLQDSSGQGNHLMGSAAEAEGAFEDAGGGATLSEGTSLDAPGFAEVAWPAHVGFSFAGWVLAADSGSIVETIGSDVATRLEITENGLPRWQVGIPYVEGAATVTGGWHHVVGVRDPGSKNEAGAVIGRALYLYVDGLLVGAIGAQGEVDVVGHKGLRVGHSLAATLDDLLVFGRALTPREVAALARVGRPFGASLVPGAAADLSDVRVATHTGPVLEPVLQASEITGRRVTPPEQAYSIWSLAGGSGGDGGSLANPAILSGVDVVPGPFGPDTAARFSGPDSSALCAGSLDLPDLESYSVEAWFRLRAGDTGGVLLGASGSPGLSLAVTQTTVCFSGLCAQGLQLDDRDWHHVAVLRTFGGPVELLLDGRLILGPQTLVAPNPTGGLPLALGASNTDAGLDGHFWGDLARIIISAGLLDATRLGPRIRPRWPAVRFEVSTLATADALHALPLYALHWGAQSPPAVPEVKPGCTELLGACNDYVGWWRLDSLSGGWVPDVSSVGRAATLYLGSGGTATLGPGIEGRAIAFGGGAHLVVPHDEGMVPAAWTVEAANHVQKSENYQAMVSKGGYVSLNHNEYHLIRVGKWGTREVVFQFVPNGQDVHLESGVAPNEWVTTAGSWQPAELGAGTLTLFGDYHDPLTTASATPPKANSGPLLIGSKVSYETGQPNSPLTGRLDEVRVRSRALQPAELMHFPALSWRPGAQTYAEAP